MKNTIKILPFLVGLVLSTSFVLKQKNDFIGTYGVSGSYPSQIELTVNPDFTFSFQDFSSSKKRIIVLGNWKLKGKKLILSSSNSENNFHAIWTFTKDYEAITSRKGATFYRLCKK